MRDVIYGRPLSKFLIEAKPLPQTPRDQLLMLTNFSYTHPLIFWAGYATGRI